MASMTVDGVTVTYHMAYNVSYNRANPHRLSGSCECGVSFLSMACSDKTARRLPQVVRDQFKWHRGSGYCRLHTAQEKGA